MSVSPVAEWRARDSVAGLLSALSIFGSLIALAYRPGKIAPFTIGLALLAGAMSRRNQRLAAFALAVGALCFVAGITLAVITNNPLL